MSLTELEADTWGRPLGGTGGTFCGIGGAFGVWFSCFLLCENGLKLI